MSSKITITQKDQHLSAQYGAGNDSLFALIGQGDNTALANVNQAYKITDDETAKTLFGENSKLHKAAKLHFLLGGRPFYAAMPTNDVVGSYSAVTSSGDGTGGVKQGIGDLAINVSSVPTASLEYVLHWMKEGGIGAAEFRYSKDNGNTWSSPFVLAGATITLAGGITLTITEGAPATNSFKVNDKYLFTTTAPTFSMTKLELALEAFRENKDIRIIRPLGAVDLPFLNVLDTFIEDMKLSKNWIRGIANLRGQNQSETDSSYFDYLLNFAQSFYSKNISILYKVASSKILGEQVSEANHYFATLSKCKVQESPGWTGKFPQEDVLSIKNWSFLKTVQSQLENEGLESLYYEDGEASGMFPYFGIGQLKAPSGSDYRKMTAGRVMDKASRLIHAAVFPFLRSNQNRKAQTSGNKVGLLRLKGRIEENLDGMVGNNEIDGYEISIPMLDDPNMTVSDIAAAILTGNLAGNVKLNHNGHIETIGMDVMYAIPAGGN